MAFYCRKIVDFGVDQDVIVTVNSNDDFGKLKLRVTGLPPEIYDMEVYVENRDVQDISIRLRIPQGGETRVKSPGYKLSERVEKMLNQIASLLYKYIHQ